MIKRKKEFGVGGKLLNKIQRKHDTFQAFEANMALEGCKMYRCAYMKNLETIQSFSVVALQQRWQTMVVKCTTPEPDCLNSKPTY